LKGICQVIVPSSTATALPGKSDSSCAVNSLVEISPQYPLRPPRVFLSAPKHSSDADGKAGHGHHDPRLHDLEQELNAGCVDLLGLHDRLATSSAAEPSEYLGSFTASSARVEESMDGILGLQLLLLQSLLPGSLKANRASHSNGFPSSEDVFPVSNRRIGGKNKKKISIQALYGREFCT
jgi:hypothetical protein